MSLLRLNQGVTKFSSILNQSHLFHESALILKFNAVGVSAYGRIHVTEMRITGGVWKRTYTRMGEYGPKWVLFVTDIGAVYHQPLIAEHQNQL